jgi:hypothetical protein
MGNGSGRPEDVPQPVVETEDEHVDFFSPGDRGEPLVL